MSASAMPPTRPLHNRRSVERGVREYLRGGQPEAVAREQRRAARRLDALVAELRGAFRADMPRRS
jgi:hypothetical protein